MGERRGLARIRARPYANEMSDRRYASLSVQTLMSVETDRRTLERLVVSLLSHRAADASICPSEVARAAEPQEWRALMPAVRAAAAGLAAAHVIDVTQRGESITLDGSARGPIRLRRGASWPRGS